MKTKILTVLLLVVVALSMISFTTVNAATATISLESKEIGAEGETTVSMNVSGSFSAESIEETIKFDNSKLEVVKIVNGDVAKKFAMASIENSELSTASAVTTKDIANQSGLITATFACNQPFTYNNGTIITVTFKAKAGVSGEQALSLTSVVDGKNDVVTSKAGSINIVVPVTGIKLDKTSASLGFGETVTLNATVEPNNASNKGVTWTSSDASVATVNNGVVKGIKEGTATITVKTNDGAKTASCSVKVECKHTATTNHPTKPSTCVEQGNAEYTTCNACGKIVSGKNEKLPLADHAYGSLIPQVDKVHTATELKNGTKAHYECSVCKKLFGEDKKEVKVEDLVIKAEHKYGDLIITEESHSAKCEECGLELVNEKHKGGIATCSTQAICEVCKTAYGELNSDKHMGGEATCIAKAICELCKKEYGEINPDNHKNIELQGDVEATTEKEGYTGDVYCKDCEKVVEKGEVIAKLEKEPVKEENVDPNKPKTADNSHIVLWISLSLISIAGVVYVIKRKQKREVND